MKNKKNRIIFIGTPDLGVLSLCTLAKDPYFDVVLAISQPDKKIGRKQILNAPPIKVEAKKLGIKIIQPTKIIEATETIKNLCPDLIVVIAYAQIIPSQILDIPKYGCVNVHGSLLPYCRGAACVQGPIMAGDKKTGITIMKMDEGLDTGPIIKQASIPIEKTDTAGTIFYKLALLSSRIINKILKEYLEGKIAPTPQNNNKATYTKCLTRQDGRINWQDKAENIERFIRAMQPWPGAYSKLDDKTIKIIAASHKTYELGVFLPGVLFSKDNCLYIMCNDKALKIEKLQLAGKNPLNCDEFINGHASLLGKKLV